MARLVLVASPDTQGSAVGMRNRRHTPIASAFRLNLAPGVRIDRGEERADALVLVSPEGKVQLNETAVLILRLCDGSRTRDDIVAEVARRPRAHTQPADIAEFLDVAQARGWIIAA